MSLERLHRRLGQRYLLCFTVLTWIASLLCGAGFVFGVVVQYPDAPVSTGDTITALAVTESGLTLGALLANGRWLRQARPLRDWARAGQPPERAPETWQLVAQLPVRFALLALPAGIVCVALPLTVLARLTFDLSAWETVFAFVGVLAGGLYLTLGTYLWAEVFLRPVRRELAARMPRAFQLERPRVPLARRLLAIQVLIGGAGGAMVSWGLTVSGGSEERAAAGLGLSTVATLTTTLGLAALFNRSFAEPVRDLVEATERINAGELGARVPILSDDEHGVLAGSFNAMSANLQRSREQQATAREEERRRLRRDLHDGLGPVLASQAMRIEAAAGLVHHKPDAAAAMLDQLRAETADTITDVRRLVQGLRPPQLDELGLVGAIERLAEQLKESRSDPESPGLEVRIEAPLTLPPLPAAVEVAAYRIAQEGLTNVVRHSRARQCLVRLEIDEVLELQVSDDGNGLGERDPAGIGLTSMRERAAELGGCCAIDDGRDGGTSVCAWLPISTPVG